MAVLNRQMFRQPFPVVRRTMGSSELGEVQDLNEQRQNQMLTLDNLEKGILQKGSNLIQKFKDFLPKPIPNLQGQNDQDQGEFAALIEKTDSMITMINELVDTRQISPSKAAELTDIITSERRKSNPNLELLNELYERIVIGRQELDAAYEVWRKEDRQLKDDTMQAEEFMNTPVEVERQMGSPPMGEQVNANNVGIMDGFEGEQVQVAEQVMGQGSAAKDEIDKSDTYDELMQSIRGDDLSEHDRRQELASIVGEKDAYETPDSVLALVQPVMQMMDTETANTGVGQIEEGQQMANLELGQRPVGIANGGFIKKYSHGGPVQYFNPGGDVKKYYDEMLPLYTELLEGSTVSPDVTAGETWGDISKAAFAWGQGASPGEAMDFLSQNLIKRASLNAKEKRALNLQLKLAALSGAQSKETALIKSKANAKDSFTMTGTKAEPSGSDGLLALKLGYSDMDTFYDAYPSGIGTNFEFSGGALTQVTKAPAVDESYTEIGIVTGNVNNDKDLTETTGLNLSIIPANTIIGKNEKGQYVFTDPGTKETYTKIGVVGSSDEGDAKITEITGLDTELLPPNTIIGQNEKGEPVITAPKQRKKIEYVITYPSYADDGETIITQTSRVDISTDEGIAEYNKLLAKMAGASKALKEYWNFEKIGGVKFESITNIDVLPSQNAKGGLIRHRFVGSDRTGENSDEIEVAESTIDFENIPTELDQSVIEGITPEVRTDSSNEQVLLQKANIGERAIQGIDELYEMALKNPEYFGILGFGASIGKSGYLSLDQILQHFTGVELPKIEFLESPIIDSIATTADELAYKIAQVKKEGTFRSITDKEKNAQKDLMNIYAGNATRTMDSLREMRKFLVRDVNEFYGMTGNEVKEFALPGFYDLDPRDIDQKDITLEIIKSKLPPEMVEKMDSDPQILNAIKSIMDGADPEEVIKRYNEHKNKAQ